MPLTPKQMTMLANAADGIANAVSKQHELADYEHDVISTEYLLTAFIAEVMMGHHPGRVRVEVPTKVFTHNIFLRHPQGYWLRQRGGKPKVRGGRIDVVVSHDQSFFRPSFMVEAKIRVRHFNHVRDDVFRFVQLLRLCRADRAIDLFGASVFVLRQEGATAVLIRARLEKLVKKIETQVGAFQLLHPKLEILFHRFDRLENYSEPRPEYLEEAGSQPIDVLDGSISLPAAVTVRRRDD